MEIEIKFFSQQIRALREEHQLTQEELARQLGVSRQSIISLERGRCLPSLPLAMHLADYFDLALENILLPENSSSIPTETSQPAIVNKTENGWEIRLELPDDIDQDKIEARLENQTLLVDLPKKSLPHPKITKIKVKKV